MGIYSAILLNENPSFVVLGYVCNVMVHTVDIFCRKMSCKHLTLNKVIRIVSGSHLRPQALPSYILFTGFSLKKITLYIHKITEYFPTGHS
jgi:hypothetical protein